MTFSDEGDSIDSDRFLLIEPSLEGVGDSTSAAAILNVDISIALYGQRSLQLNDCKEVNTDDHKGRRCTGKNDNSLEGEQMALGSMSLKFKLYISWSVEIRQR